MTEAGRVGVGRIPDVDGHAAACHLCRVPPPHDEFVTSQLHHWLSTEPGTPRSASSRRNLGPPTWSEHRTHTPQNLR